MVKGQGIWKKDKGYGKGTRGMLYVLRHRQWDAAKDNYKGEGGINMKTRGKDKDNN